MGRTTRGSSVGETTSRHRPGVQGRLARQIAVAALSASTLAGSAAAGAAGAMPTATVVAASTAAVPETYTTKAGDTLARVARQFGIKWRALAEANVETVGADPRPRRRLAVGTVLIIRTPSAPSEPSGPSASAARTFTAYVTGYTWFDNTPAGSAAISHGVLRNRAGGTGTYADPITVAVGHDLSTGRDVLDFRAGTRFYMPYLKRYFIVEDTCGDGPSPQNGACHRHPSNVSAWVDIWIGGQGGTASSADACARRITGNRAVEVNPPSGRAVTAGSVSSGGRCAI